VNSSIKFNWLQADYFLLGRIDLEMGYSYDSCHQPTHKGGLMTGKRHSDAVLDVITQQISGEVENLIVTRIQAMGFGSASINDERMSDLGRLVRRFVRRSLGEAALDYRDTTGADDEAV
jgi:hypothetical protein